MLPPIYRSAQVRNVTPICPERGRLGLGIQLEGGDVLRVALSPECVRFLMLAAADYMKSPAGCQAPMSAEMPSSPKSVPSEGDQV